MPVTQVISDTVQKSKDQRSRSPGRLTAWQKVSHIFGMGRPTNVKLGIRMDYFDPDHRLV